jgi:hypothetical protein
MRNRYSLLAVQQQREPAAVETMPFRRAENVHTHTHVNYAELCKRLDFEFGQNLNSKLELFGV